MPPVAVKVISSPWQTTTGLLGVIAAVGNGLTVTIVVATSVQLLAVTVTV